MNLKFAFDQIVKTTKLVNNFILIKVDFYNGFVHIKRNNMFLNSGKFERTQYFHMILHQNWK